MAVDLSNINPWIFSEERIDFTKIDQLTLEDLKNPQTYQKFLYTLADSEYQTNPSLINICIEQLDNLLKKNPQFIQGYPETYQQYLEIIVYLRFQSLAVQPINIILDLFKNHIILAIESQIDLKWKLESLFIRYDFAIDEWEKNRGFIIKALKENEEKIGAEKIKLQQGEKEPTIKNWLIDYFATSGSKEENQTLGRTIYLNQSTNIRKSMPKEKETLTKIFELYDYLHFDLRWDRAAEKNGLIFYQKPDIVLKRSNLLTTEKEDNGKLTNISQPRPAQSPNPFEQKYLEEESDVNKEE